MNVAFKNLKNMTHKNGEKIIIGLKKMMIV